MTDCAARVWAALAGLVGAPMPPRIGVAVSGGSDSVALMLILAEAARMGGFSLSVVTVDHRLRPGSADEAAGVAARAAGLGLPQETVRWVGWDGQGNLQDQARRARYALIAEWAQARGITHVALGHTADDQAETVLMRLARGAGVDGLSAIPPLRMVGGVAFMRPLLGLARQELRDWLAAQGQGWADDPSNDDGRFDRIKARRALDLLAPLGVDRAALADVAQNMAEARKALNWFTYLSAREVVTLDAGDIVLDRAALGPVPDEVLRRLLAHCLRWLSGAEYPPRRRPLLQMLSAARSGAGFTLHGCQMLPGRTHLRLIREASALADEVAAPGALWDGRWRLSGPETEPETGPENDPALRVALLGAAGLAQCPDWRASARPQASLLVSPAVWRGADLVAAPAAGLAQGWTCTPARCDTDFFTSMMSR